MRGKLTSTLRRGLGKRSLRLLFSLVLLSVCAVGVAADCAREIIHVRTILYGGRQYDTFVSCGSSAGNFAYTCAEGGGCYENTTVNAAEFCSCDGSGPAMEEGPVN
jgi:hypothetical protein